MAFLKRKFNWDRVLYKKFVRVYIVERAHSYDNVQQDERQSSRRLEGPPGSCGQLNTAVHSPRKLACRQVVNLHLVAD